MSNKSPDWAYWSKLPEVRVFEAVNLLLGREPGSSPPDEDDQPDGYAKSLRLLLGSLSDSTQFTPGILNMSDPQRHTVRVDEVGAWAADAGLGLPAEFPRKRTAKRSALLVQMSHPYMSLELVVDAMARAVFTAKRSAGVLADESEVMSTAALAWESRLRELAEERRIKGHHADSLAAEDWVCLDFERDYFWIEDLNACQELTDAGFSFELVQSERDEQDFLAAFGEATLNDRPISWRYWVEQMPFLSASEAARLICGLDPDLYSDLNARPVPKNRVDDVCRNAASIERLARKEGKDSDTPSGWLAWAQERHFKLHQGFVLAVGDKRRLDEAAATLRKLPPKEQAHWETAPQGEEGRRQVTIEFAGLRSSKWFTLPEFVGGVQARLQRWRQGEYFIVEAAQVLHDANRSHGAVRLCRQMENAIHLGRLTLRENGVPVEVGELPAGRLWNRMVRADDVNKWLDEASAGYALRYPYDLFERINSDDDRYRAPLFPRLAPTTPWRGKRMAHQDILPIAEAAALATTHAGHEVTVRDFLRAGARDEIPIRFICPRTVTMVPTRPGDVALPMPANSYPNLPAEACKVLSIHGKASFRSHEHCEPVAVYGGEFCYYTRWRLADSEPDLECTIDDCLVLGSDVHALADAFLEAPAEEKPETAQPVPAAERAKVAPSVVPEPSASVERSAVSVPVVAAKEVQAPGPVFSMTRAALVTRHEHHWPTIHSDLKNASTNGLAKAKAGARDWNEGLALEWARANNKLQEEGPVSADPLAQAMRNMSALPGRKNVLKG